ncbi:hypothetical protein GCM10022254_41210 [Actinomadura meridiana]|uniref:Chromosome segregation ATPase n=2 Tax=Actinomadura meridiana TaxID=559626 RepID=A0ABP8C7J1_9ACTN
MYELSRIYLRSVGPAGARYENVLLDFSKAGRPVTGYQADLFTGSPEVVRPSSASVVFLENGGGKSVLLKLVFSVLLPGQRNVVGGSDGSSLGDFVGAKDVSHVILEWTHSVTGRLLITGKTMAWKGQTVSATAENFLEQWYCLFPNEKLNLESLPVVEQGRYLTFQAYRAQLNAAFVEDPYLDLYWPRRHGDWTERLGKFGIDTELFHYQRHMNAGEGEAVRAFTMETDERFVDFLLGAVLLERDLTPLADLVSEHVEKLAKRATTVLERDFVEETLELLAPLRRDAARAAVSHDALVQAQASLSAFAGRISARSSRESSSLASLAECVKAAEVSVKEAESMATAIRIREQALRLRKAKLALQTADRITDDTKGRTRQAETEVSAWQSTGTVLDHLSNVAEAEGLRELVQERDDQARPLLEARTFAAISLSRALLGLAHNAADAAAALDEEAAGHRDREAAAREAQQTAIGKAAEATANAATLADLISSVGRRLDKAVNDGLIEAPETLATALSTERNKRQNLYETVVGAQRQVNELIDDWPRLDADQRSADLEAKDAERRHDAARDAVEEAHRRRAILQAEDRLAELLQTGDVLLEQDAPTLAKLLTEAIAEHTHKIVALMIEQAHDERDRLTLAEGDLLPPLAGVEEACAVLLRENIQAWPGWRYVSDIQNRDRRRELVRVHPHLVAGILLNSKEHIEDARRILSDERHQSASAVTVATTEELEQAGAGVPAFVLPFKPALYDEAAAEREHERIESRHRDRDTAIAALTEAREEDTNLLSRVRNWLQGYPPGRVTALEGDCDRAAAELTEATAVAATTERAKKQNESRLFHARVKRQVLEEERTKSEDLVRTLTSLANEAEKIPGWKDERKGLLETARVQSETAESLGDDALNENRLATDAVREADRQHRAKRDLDAERAALPGAEKISDSGARPSEPVPVLRKLYAAAAERYQQVATDEDLMERLVTAEKAAAATTATYEALDSQTRERAQVLLKTPAGASAASRASALESAVQARAVADEDHQNALVRQGVCKHEAQRLQLAWDEKVAEPVDSFLDPLPMDVTACDLSTRLTLDEHAAAARLVTEREKELEIRQGELSGAEEAARSFGVLAKGLEEDLTDSIEAAYEGDYASAANEYEVLFASRRSTRSTALADADQVRKSGRALHTLIRSDRFAELGAAVQREINATEPEQLPEKAAAWEERLRPRLRSLNDDLEQTERHRRNIVTNLKGETDKAIGVLRTAQRVSRLPSSLGDWHNEEFLRFQFELLGNELLMERLGEVVDEAAAGKISDNRKVQRTGLALILRAVHAATPKGIKVYVLKPDTTLRAERERVSRVKKVFSGGQQLTAAILLYCTMAALRGNDRGRRVEHRAGLLFLDNPIGRANAYYLLDLQLSVARALGVQLVYTTGLFDDRALRQFPLIISLRNDEDLRSARKFLSVDARVKGHLDALPPSDGVGRISTARIYSHGRGTEQAPPPKGA